MKASPKVGALAMGLAALAGLAAVLLVQSRGSQYAVPIEEPAPIDFPVATAPSELQDARPVVAQGLQQRQPRLSLEDLERDNLRRKLREQNLDPGKLPTHVDPYAKYTDPRERERARVEDEFKEFTRRIRMLEAKLAENEQLNAMSKKQVRQLKLRLEGARQALDIVKWRKKNLEAGIWPEPPFSQYPGYQKLVK